jgi:hypothetical protein
VRPEELSIHTAIAIATASEAVTSAARSPISRPGSARSRGGREDGRTQGTAGGAVAA